MMGNGSRATLAAAAIAMLVAVAGGAFGAHALRATLGAERLAVWHTAVEYQAWHALALLALGVLRAHVGPSATLAWAARLFGLGIVLFSGSLYLLVLTGMRPLGALTPLGGVAFLVGWALLAAWALRGGVSPPSRPTP